MTGKLSKNSIFVKPKNGRFPYGAHLYNALRLLELDSTDSKQALRWLPAKSNSQVYETLNKLTEQGFAYKDADKYRITKEGLVKLQELSIKFVDEYVR